MLAAVRSPWVRKAIAVVAVLSAANLALLVVGPALPDPVVYPTREIQLSIDRLDAQTAEGCVDLLVTGNSVAAEAIAAQPLAEAVGLRTGVVSVLPGSIATVDVDWMNRVTLPRARPGTVLYVATPLMFVPEELAGTYGLELYTRAAVTRGGWPGDLHRWAIDHVPLIEDRLVLSDFEALVDGARGDLPTSYEEVIAQAGWVLEADGHIRSSGSWDERSPFLDRIRDELALLGNDWRVDREQRERLREHFVDLMATGTQVVMVIPPVVDDLPPVFPSGGRAFDDYLDAARGLGAGTDLITVDLSAEPYPDELFRDTHHVNQQGSERLTAEVAEALAGEDLRPCSPSDPGRP
jgi:hypothetical protein